MKKIIISLLLLTPLFLIAVEGIIMGESVERYRACGTNSKDLNYTHEQVSRTIEAWKDKGGGEYAHFHNDAAWGTDLQDSSLSTNGTDYYTDNKAEIIVFSGHGSISGYFNSSKIWSTTYMCPHNNDDTGAGEYIKIDNKGQHLILFTCYSVHDFRKDNNLPASWKYLKTSDEWYYPFQKNIKNSISRLNMVYGFAGLSTDSDETDENGEDFIEDIYIQSQKQAWFTGNEDSGGFWYWLDGDADIDDRAGVITWGQTNGIYNYNAEKDAKERRDNHKIIERSTEHTGNIILTWSHHDC